jgi:GxxExxY protein
MRKRKPVDIQDLNTPDEPEFDALSKRVIGCAIEVHKTLGPGLLESIYEESLSIEMSRQGLRFRRQVEVPVAYKGVLTGGVARADFIVEDVLCIEIKAVENLLTVHRAQLHTYLKLFDLQIGLLLNFNTFHLSEGIRRVTRHEGY